MHYRTSAPLGHPCPPEYPHVVEALIKAEDEEEFHAWFHDNMSAYETATWYHQEMDEAGTPVYRVIVGCLDVTPAVHFKLRWY